MNAYHIRPQGIIRVLLAYSLLIGSAAFPMQLKAQTQQSVSSSYVVKGQVTDTSGEPLIGASILAVGENIGATTDVDGKFELRFSNPVTLKIPYARCKNKKVKVFEATNLNIELESLDGESEPTKTIIINTIYYEIAA